MNPTEDAVDHRNARTTIPPLIKNGKNDLVKAITKAAMFIGQTQ